MRGRWLGGAWTLAVLLGGVACVAAGLVIGFRSVSVSGVVCGSPFQPHDETFAFVTYDPLPDVIDCGPALDTRLAWAVLLVVLGGVAAVLSGFVMMVTRPEELVTDPEQVARTDRRLRRRALAGALITTAGVVVAVVAATQQVSAAGVDCGSVLRGAPSGTYLGVDDRAACDEAMEGRAVVFAGAMAFVVVSGVVTGYWVARIQSPEVAEASYRLGSPF